VRVFPVSRITSVRLIAVWLVWLVVVHKRNCLYCSYKLSAPVITRFSRSNRLRWYRTRLDAVSHVSGFDRPTLSRVRLQCAGSVSIKRSRRLDHRPLTALQWSLPTRRQYLPTLRPPKVSVLVSHTVLWLLATHFMNCSDSLSSRRHNSRNAIQPVTSRHSLYYKPSSHRTRLMTLLKICGVLCTLYRQNIVKHCNPTFE